MERCPVCNRITAERNLYTKQLECYHKSCGYKEKQSSSEDKALLVAEYLQKRGVISDLAWLHGKHRFIEVIRSCLIELNLK